MQEGGEPAAGTSTAEARADWHHIYGAAASVILSQASPAGTCFFLLGGAGVLGADKGTTLVLEGAAEGKVAVHQRGEKTRGWLRHMRRVPGQHKVRAMHDSARSPLLADQHCLSVGGPRSAGLPPTTREEGRPKEGEEHAREPASLLAAPLRAPTTPHAPARRRRSVVAALAAGRQLLEIASHCSTPYNR